MHDRNVIFYEGHAEAHRQELMRAAEAHRQAGLALDSQQKPQRQLLPALGKPIRALASKAKAWRAKRPQMEWK